MELNHISLPTFALPSPEELQPFAAAAPPPSTLHPQPSPIHTLSLHFPQIPLFPRQIPQFRGAIIESAGKAADLFHNHADESDATLHRPALIHYRCAGGKALIWSMNAGADALSRWITQAPERMRMDGGIVSLYPVEMRRSKADLQISPDWHYYRLHDYLALNPDNYQRWLDERRMISRAAIIEQALTNHLLAFCQGAGWWLPERLEVELVDIHGYQKTRYHHTELLRFELTYRCNLLLPDEIALGKAVSHGFGVQRQAPNFR